jgi:hypothetical protein
MGVSLFSLSFDAQDKMKISPLSLCSDASYKLSRSHFIVPCETTSFAQKLELKIDPFAAGAKMHLAVAWFVLHWHY